MSKKVIILFAVVCLVLGDDCGDSFSCTEKKLVQLLDQYEEAGDVGGFLRLVKTKEIYKPRSGEESLIDRCVRFLQEHELRLRIPQDEARNFDLSKFKYASCLTFSKEKL